MRNEDRKIFFKMCIKGEKAGNDLHTKMKILED